MNLNLINQESNVKWFADNGNYTHAINYNINEYSMVVDVGGYIGLWADLIIEKYNPYITIVEPIKDFYDQLCNKFKDNPKVTVLNYGISTTNKSDVIYLNGDGTSKYLTNDKPITVNFITIDELLKIIKRDNVELMQINIEGEEFPLLENMIDTGTILKFNNIQVQFHTFIEDAFEKRNNIQKGLEKNNFKKLYDYPFVFEAWSLK
jgi:FkbM family methyltransferase